jgi:hypothetical protein
VPEIPVEPSQTLVKVLVPGPQGPAGNGTGSGSVDPAALEAAKARANHTGVQPASTISDLAEVVQDLVAALLQPGSGVSLVYDDALGALVISSTISGSAGIAAEEVRDIIGTALRAGTGMSLVVDDTNDILTFNANVRSVAGRTGDVVITQADVGSLVEKIQDTVAGQFAGAHGNATVTYDDVSGSMTITVTGAGTGDVTTTQLNTALTSERSISESRYARKDVATTFAAAVAFTQVPTINGVPITSSGVYDAQIADLQDGLTTLTSEVAGLPHPQANGTITTRVMGQYVSTATTADLAAVEAEIADKPWATLIIVPVA